MKNLHRIRPYGDHWDDGRMQFSFTLPLSCGEEAKEAARLTLEKLGFTKVLISWMESAGEGFSYFVAYGQAPAGVSIDATKIRLTKPEFPILSPQGLIQKAREQIKRRIVVIGAATGSDAHTVGIDAILSVKGIHGDKGLEYYPFFRVINLRAQVDNRHLVEEAVRNEADVLLVSKMVTQQDQHLKDLRDLSRLLKEDKRLPKGLVKIAGGPLMDHKTARSIGFDAGFGPGTKPSEVASFIVHSLMKGEEKASSSQKTSIPLLGWLLGK